MSKNSQHIRGEEGGEVIGPLGPSGSFLGLWFYSTGLGSNENVLNRIVTLCFYRITLVAVLRID